MKDEHVAIITFLSDFGLDNWFAGTMKGVIKSINSSTEIVDISHDISNFNVNAGAFVLKNSYCYFPQGTIHVAVVDPGVGSERAGLLVETERYFFVAPDNGVLSYTLEQEQIRSIIRLTNSDYFLSSTCNTFHGRDIFAPVAAHLSNGVAPSQFGEVIDKIICLSASEPRKISASEILGHIIYVDRFGNLVSDISRPMLDELLEISKRGRVRIAVRDREISTISLSYSDGRAGEVVALIGSSDYLELAVNQGSAAEILNTETGTELILKVI